MVDKYIDLIFDFCKVQDTVFPALSAGVKCIVPAITKETPVNTIFPLFSVSVTA